MFAYIFPYKNTQGSFIPKGKSGFQVSSHIQKYSLWWTSIGSGPERLVLMSEAPQGGVVGLWEDHTEVFLKLPSVSTGGKKILIQPTLRCTSALKKNIPWQLVSPKVSICNRMASSASQVKDWSLGPLMRSFCYEGSLVDAHTSHCVSVCVCPCTANFKILWQITKGFWTLIMLLYVILYRLKLETVVKPGRGICSSRLGRRLE